MSAAPTLTLTEAYDPALDAVIHANFLDHARAGNVPSDFRPVVIHVRQDGAVLGGLVGRTVRQWLFIDTIALPVAAAGQGLGRQLIGMAEAEAIARGCFGSFLQTVEFQAPGFYERLGYHEYARLPHGVDERLTRIWFAKIFAR